MRGFLKEPLLHFLLLGAVLFLVFGLAKKEEAGDSDDKIVVSAGRIEQLSNVYAKIWQRPPNEEELKALIDDFVLEEIYYRQAREMGIDRDDTIIRRRLRQKLEFLTDDAAALVEPSQENLAAYLADNEERFREDSTYTFRQIYLNPEKHGEDLKGYVEAQLVALRAGETVHGDSGLLAERYESATNRLVDGTFGLGFSEMLDALEVGDWKGPVESGLGLHLIRIESRNLGSVPNLAEIKPVVEREWANEKRLEMRRVVNETLRKEYEIVIEWPEGAK